MDHNKPALRRSTTGIGINLAIIVFNAALIAAVWIAVLEVARIDRQETIKSAIGRNDNLAIAFEQYTVRTIESADAIIQYMIREYVRGGGKPDLDRFVADYTTSNRAFTGIVLADEHGDVATTAYASKPARPVNVADREHFSVHVARDSQKIFVGKPVLDRVTGKAVVPITRRVNKPDGSFGGVAIVLIEHPRFTDVLQDARMRQLDIISLVGLDGITRARLRGTTPTAGEDIGKSPLFAEQALRPVGSYTAAGQVDGIRRIFSYRTLPEYQLIATIGAAEADVLAGFFRRQQQYFWAAGIASVFITAFTGLLLFVLAGQRRAAAGVERSQARFLATFNQAAVGIALTHLDGRFLDVNQKLCDILGYTREELLVRNFSEITHPDDLAANIEFRNQVSSNPDTGNSLQLEKRHIRKDGTVVWCLLTSSTVRDREGRIEYLASVIQDISERKRAEQDQAQLAAIVESSNDAIISRSLDGTILSWNRAAERMFGWSAAEAIGRPSRIITPPDYLRKFTHVLQRVRQGEAAAPFETMRMRRDGTCFDAQVSLSAVKDNSGNVVAIANIVRDITDRKRAEQAQAQLAAIVESSNDAIISRTPDRTIISWNPAAERMFGWTAAEAIGQSVRIITPPEHIGLLDPLIQQLLRGEATAPVDTRRIRKDGSRFEAQISLSAIRDGEGNVTAIATIIRDITARKLAEAALRDYAAQMRHLSWRLSEVEERERRDIHRELHDQVGANLSALKLDLNLIGSLLPADTPQTLCDRLQKAQHLTGETIARIRDVMAELRPPALDDYGLLAALRSCAQPFALRLGIPLLVDGDDIQPRPAIAVETALFRIAQEAINNIAKHAQARHVGITVTATGKRVSLVVADDGVGFDAVHPDPRQPGWGLRTMRERAQAIAADLRIESAPGQGTRIIVELAREAS